DLAIGPVAARGSYSISVRRGSAGSSSSGPGVQETGYATVEQSPLKRICVWAPAPETGDAGPHQPRASLRDLSRLLAQVCKGSVTLCARHSPRLTHSRGITQRRARAAQQRLPVVA